MVHIYSSILQYALVFIPGLVVGRIFDMGYVKLPLGLASALLVVATFLTAECKEYWQFLLCQGIAIGVRLVSILIHRAAARRTVTY